MNYFYNPTCIIVLYYPKLDDVFSENHTDILELFLPLILSSFGLYMILLNFQNLTKQMVLQQ